jgi:hypothetical protein
LSSLKARGCKESRERGGQRMDMWCGVWTSRPVPRIPGICGHHLGSKFITRRMKRQKQFIPFYVCTESILLRTDAPDQVHAQITGDFALMKTPSKTAQQFLQQSKVNKCFTHPLKHNQQIALIVTLYILMLLYYLGRKYIDIYY